MNPSCAPYPDVRANNEDKCSSTKEMFSKKKRCRYWYWKNMWISCKKKCSTKGLGIGPVMNTFDQ
jgi:hypothetical protein